MDIMGLPPVRLLGNLHDFPPEEISSHVQGGESRQGPGPRNLRGEVDEPRQGGPLGPLIRGN